MLKYKRKFGIFLFSALVLAIGFSPIASAHYNGDHVSVEKDGNFVVVNMIPTPVQESISIFTNASGKKFYINTGYGDGTTIGGVPGTTFLRNRYYADKSGNDIVLSPGYFWNVTIKLPYIAGYISKSEFLNYVSKTDFAALSIDIDTTSDNIVPFTSVTTSGANFVLVQTVGDTKRYFWVYDTTGLIPSDSIIDNLFDGDVDNVDGDVPFIIPFTNDGELHYLDTYDCLLYPFRLTNNPDGAFLPDSDSTTIIVDSIDNLGNAFDSAISAGVDEISSVVLQQTDEITGAVESQTEAILNYRSDVDMSVSQNAEVATKLAEESLINQKIYDQYADIDYDRNLAGNIDSDFGDGVGFLTSAMQTIFDFGIGNLVVVLLTIGTSLFIIGRSMR